MARRATALADRRIVDVDRQYGRSVLATGLVRLGRAKGVVAAVVIANAVVQALLVVGDPVPSFSPWFLVLTLLSAIVLLTAYAVITAAALDAVTGPVTVRQAVSTSQAHPWAFLLWAVLLVFASMVLALFGRFPGLLVPILLPYVLLAVTAGRRNPLRANFTAIGALIGRYAVTMLLSLVIMAFTWLVAALLAFFVTGMLSALLTWLLLGLVLAWLTFAWAVLFRSTPA